MRKMVSEQSSILGMIIIIVTITFIIMNHIIRGSRLRSPAGVCCHGLPFPHWQSHSGATKALYATSMLLPSDTFHALDI